MPTYEYRCRACKHLFEVFQSMKDRPKRKCPACGKNTLDRLIGIGAAVLFKGSGFYQTDYRSDSYKKAAKADTGGGGAGGAGGGGDGGGGGGEAAKPAKPAATGPAPGGTAGAAPAAAPKKEAAPEPARKSGKKSDA